MWTIDAGDQCKTKKRKTEQKFFVLHTDSYTEAKHDRNYVSFGFLKGFWNACIIVHKEKKKKLKKKEGAYKNALRKAPYIPSLSCFPQPGGSSGNELQVVHRV